MFREMIRNRQQLTKAQCIDILKKNTCGVLAVLGDGGYPYAVPLSYVYDNDSVYFHCAKAVISSTQSKLMEKHLSA